MLQIIVEADTNDCMSEKYGKKIKKIFKHSLQNTCGCRNYKKKKKTSQNEKKEKILIPIKKTKNIRN